jgi:hypothetical protein
MGATGRVALLTLTIDPGDPRLADPSNRAGKQRPPDPRDPTSYIAGESVRYAAWAWNRFRTYLTREYGAVPFFKGLELQQSGMAHLHVIVRLRDSVEFMALRSLIRGPEDDRDAGLAVRAGFGIVVDMQLARAPGDVARYVTKAGSGLVPGGKRSGPEGVRPVTSSGDGRAAAYVTKGLDGSLPRYTRRSSWSTGRSAWAPDWRRPEPIRGFTWRVAQASASVVSDALVRSEFVIADPALVRAARSAPGPAGAEGSA